jgi:hypothetical protein
MANGEVVSGERDDDIDRGAIQDSRFTIHDTPCHG